MATSTQADVASFGNLEVTGPLRTTSFTDDSANSGNRTVNTVRGQSAIAIGAPAVTITNSLCRTTSLVIAVIAFTDATLTTLLSVVPQNGSFIITGNANATAATKVGWIVIN